MPSANDLLKVIQESAYFDAVWYRETYPDVAFSGLPEAEHYLRVGTRLNRNPGPDFDAAAYLETYRDVVARGENPLVHFERHGQGERRDPKPVAKEPGPVAAGARERVDVVVAVYNALEDVQACLASLARCDTGFAVRVIVVNDGSDAETSDWLREACAGRGSPRVRFTLIEHDGNKGYTKAVNTGLMAANAPYVVTLNSDTIVTSYWLDGMVRCMKSDPEIGIVGPLSNAASWQNVPELRGPDGVFAVNDLPKGGTPEDMAAVVRQASQQVYPRSTFVNGFCFMIRRAVLEAVGYMDEGAFPMGYGEENDFCIRAQDAGFALAYADDTYVFHAKSKSFGHSKRTELSKVGGEALRAKHGRQRFETLVRQVSETATMDAVRRRVQRQLALFCMSKTAAAADMVTAQKILFLLPVGGVGGGAHSIIQEATAMRRIGITARIAVFHQDYRDFLRLYADLGDAASLFVVMRDDRLTDLAQDYDVVIATFHSSVERLERILKTCPWILPAYYAQDYEPAFYDEGTAAHREALASYTRIPDAVVFAKTDWLCGEIESRHGIRVHKVTPSIDQKVYHPPGGARLFDPERCRVAAMVRPSTPRRGAGRTMEALARLKDACNHRLKITVFGCEDADIAAVGLKRDFDFTNRGVLTRAEVAELLRETDIFVDLSDYQAFGRTALEAMACGATVVVPKTGGCAEYAQDGYNALVVDSVDPETCHTRLVELIGDQEKLARMRLQALQTAAGYSAARAALSELILLGQSLAERRARFPIPARKTAPEVLQPSEAPPGQTSTGTLARFPTPAFSPRGYQLEPYSSGPVMVLPFESDGLPRQLPEMDIGIHLHLHYADLLQEFIRYLSHVPVPFHLYVSVAEETQVGATAEALTGALPKAKVTVRAFVNRGRDIGPFLAGFGREMAQHEYVCHIHSKRSPHNPAKQDWRNHLMTHLMGSDAIVAETLHLLQKNDHLGMVFPEYHWSLAEQIGWGTNYPVCEALADRMGLDISADRLDLFPAGSMFWARGAALSDLFALDLGFQDFPEEAAQVDGTLAHAVERLLGTIVVQAGFKLQQARSDKPHDLLSYYTAKWPYRGKSCEKLNAVVAGYRKARRAETAAPVGLLCANIGNYDTLSVHEHLDPEIDYLLVSDGPVNDRGFWKPRALQRAGATATLSARGVKTDPFPYLEGYEAGIWIDANVMIRESLAPYLEKMRAHPDIPLFGIPHPHRRCLYEEAQTVIAYKKVDPAEVRAQINAYTEEGYPKRNGLIETNFLMFNLKHPKIRDLFALWREQIATRTHRDQLSLNYALWKLGLDWLPLMEEGKNLRTEPQFAYFGHGRNSGYRPVEIDGARIVKPGQPDKEHMAYG